MKTALAIWDERIAPVFDEARQVRIVETKSGKIVKKFEIDFHADDPYQKIVRLAREDVRVLICGAISRPLQETAIAYNMRLISFVTGNAGDILEAWLRGDLDRSVYAMPGCSGHHRRFAARRAFGRMGYPRGGRFGFCGGGMSDYGRHYGGSQEIVTRAFAACPSCGWKGTMEKEVPSGSFKCPECGTHLIIEGR